MTETTRPLHPDTLAVHTAAHRSPYGETSEALFLTQGFVYPDMETAEARFKDKSGAGFVYSRFGNPTVAMFEQRIAALEGAEAARATATGMAAVAAALMGPLKAGDHVVAASVLFGSCRFILAEILPKFGITTTFVDATDPQAWRAAMRPETALLFLESPANPTMDLVDIAAIAEIAHAGGALLVVDNALGIPTVSNPLALGADVVTYSATKHIDGQGRCLGGVVLASKAFIEEKIQPWLRHTGPALSPFNAWVMLKSLETLTLRVERQARNALAMAQALEGAPGIVRVRYPGLPSGPDYDLCRRQMTCGGTVLAIDVAGGKAGAFAFGRALRVMKISNNFGDAKSLVTHPATTTHERFTPDERAAMGIGDGMLRISAGLEHAEDLVADVLGAAEAAATEIG
ncbi:O-succinylhomoserine sulfhydrylase [Salinarimonas ramus]|uniref:O-succinylhomoserine sulfhydrylase n=1 Tax=Salinarimonas ramus TaxID=690164 RepID=A0A917Q6B6_9HYPH|nr:O-succinylhomoserine sulfhydrylase [Salinarimonas ramus]GGK31332.1 O-succinylhomoserine sulfhydrylase [Salinarimonas ramus]